MKTPALFVSGALFAGVILVSGRVDAPATGPSATLPRAPLQPVPYRFMVEEIELTARGRHLMRDGFDRAGVFRPAQVGGREAADVGYFVNMGSLDGSAVRNGRLHIEQSCSINPFENFACDFSLPVDDHGRRSFVGSEYFGDLELHARLAQPRIGGPEKFKLGLVDDQLFFGAATVSYEKDKVTLERQGGEPRTVTPFLETTFDEVDLKPFGAIDELDLRLRVDVAGRATATATVRAGGAVEVFRLTTDTPWARLNPRGRYSAHVFIEDLAQPRIFSVYPETITAEQLKMTRGAVPMKVFGIGFGEDSNLEIVPAGGGEAAWAREADILMFNMGLKTKIVLPSLDPGAYTVRVHSSGMSASVERGLRVLP